MSGTRSGLLAGLTISIVAILAAAAVLFASGDGTIAIARDATVQQRAEAVLGAAAAARAALAESLLLEEASRAGLTPPSTAKAAVEDAHTVIRGLHLRFGSLIDSLEGPAPNLMRAGERLVSSGEFVLGHLGNGDVEAARAEAEGDFSTAYEQAIDLVSAERDARERSIAVAREGVGRVTNAARFTVAFLVPAIAMLAYRAMVRRQQQRQELERRLADEQRLNLAKDQFLASVSHELRTPLTAVLGFSELLREGRHSFSSPERNELIDLIAEQAEESSHIIEDLLVAARADLGELTVEAEAFDARALVDSTIYGWNRRRGTVPDVEGQAAAWGDPLRTRQIIRNLLSNAVRYGGDRITVNLAESDGSMILQVRDDGPGVPDSERERIFEPYGRAHRVGSEPASVGLGLTVSRKLARLMGGDLAYQRAGGESVFQLTLPAASDSLHRGEVTGPRELGAQDILALLDGGPEIIFQPVLELAPARDGRSEVVGWEALSRFPTGSPTHWFAAAGKVGLRLELETVAMQRAIREFVEAGVDGFLSVNVSDDTLVWPGLIQTLDAGLDPSRLVLELTESEASKDYGAVEQAAGRLAALGYRLAMDDVGSGVLDLWQVLRLRPSIIKLDMALTSALEGPGAGVVRGLCAVAADLDAMVVAEGVERGEQLDRLVELGVGFGQGYHLAEPGPIPVPA